MQKKNNYSWSLDTISHGTAHLSKNWTAQDQKEYNHWYYINKIKNTASDLANKANHGVMDTIYDATYGKELAETPGSTTFNNITGLGDLYMKSQLSDSVLDTPTKAVLDHHFKNHTLAGKAAKAISNGVKSISKSLSKFSNNISEYIKNPDKPIFTTKSKNTTTSNKKSGWKTLKDLQEEENNKSTAQKKIEKVVKKVEKKVGITKSTKIGDRTGWKKLNGSPANSNKFPKSTSKQNWYKDSDLENT